MTPQDNIMVIRSMFDAFRDHDLTRAVSIADKDMEVILVPSCNTYHGPEGWKHQMRDFTTAFPDMTTEITNIFAGDDWVCVEHTVRGTHTGPMHWLPESPTPTGRKFEVPFCDIYHMRNGKVIGVKAYYDMTAWLRQLGPMPGTTRLGM